MRGEPNRAAGSNPARRRRRDCQAQRLGRPLLSETARRYLYLRAISVGSPCSSQLLREAAKPVIQEAGAREPRSRACTTASEKAIHEVCLYMLLPLPNPDC